MLKQYLVLILDVEDKITHTTWCKTDVDLANLLLHIDKSQYCIVDISVIDALQEDNREFFRTTANLEIGEQK